MRSKLQRPENHSDVNPWQRWALNIGAVLGSFCLLFAVATLIFGLKPLIFASGSMGPAIPAGSLGLAVPMPVAEVIPGQVVSVVTSDGTRVTHRVVENRPEGLILKGDANSTTDLQPYQVVTADRILLSVPMLGFVVSWISQPWAFFVGGLLCAYLLYLAFFQRDSSTTPGNGSHGDTFGPPTNVPDIVPDGDTAISVFRRRVWFGVCAVVTALTLVIPFGSASLVEPTHAAFAGHALASAPVKALLLPPVPGKLSCTTTGPLKNNVDLSWMKADLPANTRYVVQLTHNDRVGYIDSGTTLTTRFTGTLSLLASLFDSAATWDVRILTVKTVNNAPVTGNGSNILWASDEKTAPITKVRIIPGLLATSYQCVTA